MKTFDQLRKEIEEGSIKGSGTDRKAMLKKAYRRGETKTRDFYQGKISSAPKSYDKGQKAAFKKGTTSNQGSPAAQGAKRSQSQDRLKDTEHSKQIGMPAISKHRNKKHALTFSKPRNEGVMDKVKSAVDTITGKKKRDAEAARDAAMKKQRDNLMTAVAKAAHNPPKNKRS